MVGMELLTNLVIDSIERGRVPDPVTRRLTRRLCRQRLSALQRQYANQPDHGVPGFASHMRQGPVAPVPDIANQQHYELPAGFFQRMLGPRLKYSSGYFETPNSTLAEAEIAALRQTCDHAELADGMDVLELGCGWGSLTLWMLEQYPNLSVTAVSNSRFQRQLIEELARDRGLAERLTVITADMNDFSIDRRFERVVSCEMFEHMRNYQRLLHRIAGWLTGNGRLFVHIFCHRRFAYEFQAAGASNWMGRYFFTGGIMPSANLLDQFQEDLRVIGHHVWDGTHYQRTCNAWLDQLDQHRDQIRPILRDVYGDAADRWLGRWRLFLMAGAELFGFDSGRQWQVGHYLLARP